MKKIFSLVDETPFISEIHKRFYKHMLEARYTLIIQSTYDLLKRKRV